MIAAALTTKTTTSIAFSSPSSSRGLRRSPRPSPASSSSPRRLPPIIRRTTTMALPADLAAVPGTRSTAQPEETRGYCFQQTMLRIKDPKQSLEFYTEVLGMTLVLKLDFPDMAFSLYFLAFVDDPSEIPADKKERAAWVFRQPACLELTHNYGTESDPNFEGYKSGNEAEHKGFGHIGLSVPDVYKACARFEERGVRFVKNPDDGKMKGLAFVKDPDGYWIEILNADNVAQYA